MLQKNSKNPTPHPSGNLVVHTATVSSALSRARFSIIYYYTSPSQQSYNIITIIIIKYIILYIARGRPAKTVSGRIRRRRRSVVQLAIASLMYTPPRVKQMANTTVRAATAENSYHDFPFPARLLLFVRYLPSISVYVYVQSSVYIIMAHTCVYVWCVCVRVCVYIVWV